MIKKSELETRIKNSEKFKSQKENLLKLIRNELENANDIPVYVLIPIETLEIVVNDVMENCLTGFGYNIEVQPETNTYFRSLILK